MVMVLCIIVERIKSCLMGFLPCTMRSDIADAAKEPDRVDKRMAKAEVGADYMVVSGFANRDVNGKVVEIEPFISCETKSSSFFNSKPAWPSSTSIGSKSSASN